MTKQHFLYGLHAVISILEHSPEKIEKIYLLRGRRDQRIEELLQLAKSHGLTLTYIEKQEMDKQVGHSKHQGVIAQHRVIKTYQEHDLQDLITHLDKPPFLLILDGIQDPHNLGACLRTANAAGVDAVIAPKDKSVGLTPTVYKVASGAAEVTPFIQVTNLARTITWLKEQNIWIYGAAEQTESDLYNLDLNGPIAIVMGSEGKGLRRLTREHCDHLIRIPMLGTISSLNVSVATGICLYEVVRQRNQ